MEDRPRSVVVRVREFVTARPRIALMGGLAAGVLLLFLLASNPGRPPVHQNSPFATGPGTLSSEIPSPDGSRREGSDGKILAPPAVSPDFYRAGPGELAGALHEPRIYFSAQLSIITREFSRSRSNMEEILERHHGYTSRLRMVGQSSGSVLTATLRVPSSEYRSALTDLKTVGLVEHEEEAVDEITQQHSELEARLVNAQNEEKRILQMLQNRSDKTKDSASLEQQVALLRSEIERMQSERYSSDNRLTLANISFSLREERTPVAETIGAKLRNAAVGGLSDAFESISAILLFLAGRGPLLGLWVALLYFPARFLWRRRSLWAFSGTDTPKDS
jgi:uncharacterized small protein (DUF1192 family)